MKALEFIKEYNKENKGMIAGGYCLHKALGTEFTDIDFYCSIPINIIKNKYLVKKLRFPEHLAILGHTFDRSGDNYVTEKLTMLSYKSKFEDYIVNVVMIEDLNYYKILESFDLSILRCCITNFETEEIDIKLHDYQLSIDKKIVVVGSLNNIFEHDDSIERIEKYKKRLPGFIFVRSL